MMLVLSLLIVATLVLSFYSVDEVTQVLFGTGAVYALAVIVVLAILLMVWKKRRAAAKVQQDGATH